MTADQIKTQISDTLKSFAAGNLTSNALSLFQALGYVTERQAPLDQPTFAEFKDTYIGDKKFDETKAKVSDWKYVDLLFQLSKEEVLKQISLFDTKQVDRTIIETYLFFAIELSQAQYTRTELSVITREVNRLFPMPVMILFKYNKKLTLSVINRRLHKKYEDRDVLEKVTLIKDINIEEPHRAHIEILYDLSFDELKRTQQITNFVELHNAWQKTLDLKELNRVFYQKLFDWYLWALKEVKFPQIRPEKDMLDDNVHQSESLIRLLTRLLFVWFMKEKGLINPDLFIESKIKKILKNFEGDKGEDTIFYKAILQNLFFATLNKPIDQRKKINKGFNPKEYGDPLVYRFEELFIEPENLLEYFRNIPFLNGGLFECLDQKKDDENLVEIRLDGFSTMKSKQVHLPDKYFFGEHTTIDLSEEYGDSRKQKVTVYGLVEIFEHYKFTVEENTPIEEEIALDPELLGKVFENLLASYIPETKTTARKQTGSFYTPREIVDYMVDESLITYLRNTIDDENRLRKLFSYAEKNETNPFNEQETLSLIKSIDNCKILDPACGSGAFPMGVLQKLTHILHKLDPENQIWFDIVISNLPVFIQTEAREKLKKEKRNYVRKLGIIHQCIYGIDIQPIAIQISKLRFFISLLVDQRKKPEAPNFGFEPLPNLDFKLVAANTLISAPENDAIEVYAKDALKSFENLTNEYFSAVNERKIEIKEEIKKNTTKIVAANQRAINQWIEKIKREKNAVSDARKKQMGKQMDDFLQDLERWNTFPNIYKNESVAFFETKYFFHQVKNGFDIVIGNPPFGAKFTNEEKEYFKKNYKHQDYQPESFLLFTEKGFELLKDKAVISFIIPNTWLTNLKLVKIRRFLTGANTIQNISHYQKSVFDAVVDTEVVVFRKGYSPDNVVKVFNHIDTTQIQEINHNQDNWKAKNGDVINIFSSKKIEQIIEIIKTDSVMLSTYCEIVVGMKPYQVGKGKPKQTQDVVQERIFDSSYKINDEYKKLLRGSDIDKYEIKWDGRRWIKFGEWLAEPRYSANFEADEKIVIRQTGDSLIATIDNSQFVCMNNLHVLNIKKSNVSLRYILALINSTLLNFYFQYLNPESGEALAEVKKETVEKLLIKEPQNEKPFIILVDFILLIKKQKRDSSFLERLIDAMIYELYLPEPIKAAGCEVLKYLDNLPELSEGEDEGNLKTIEKVYEELSDPGHPISKAIDRMDAVEEIRIIEGKQ